jgi:hypothetical protein
VSDVQPHADARRPFFRPEEEDSEGGGDEDVEGAQQRHVLLLLLLLHEQGTEHRPLAQQHREHEPTEEFESSVADSDVAMRPTLSDWRRTRAAVARLWRESAEDNLFVGATHRVRNDF